MFFPFFYDWCVGFGTGDVIERIDEIFFFNPKRLATNQE
jgi:hypothetical protein